MRDRLPALLMAGAMLLTLAACGGSPRSTPVSAENTASQSEPVPEASDTEAASQAPEEPSPETAEQEAAPEAETPPQEVQTEAEAPEGFQLQEGEWYTPGEGADADGRGPDELEENEVPDGEQEGQMLTQGITDEEFAAFGVTVPDAGQKAKGFRDFDETLHSSFLGTWYDPEAGEALRITEDGAYVYIPYLGLWGEELCPWELIDRSERGKVPMLAIYCFGEDGGPLAYYVAGNTGDYFWCVSQGQLFYRQD